MVEITAGISKAINRKAFQNLARRYPQKVADNLQPAMRNALTRLEDAVDRRFKPYRRGSYTRFLRKRSGALQGSFVGEVRGTGYNAEARHYTSSRYARLQEFGGTITPKRARYLKIPLPSALLSSGNVDGGLQGGSAGNRFTANGTPTHVRRSKAGNLLIFNSTTGEPLFALKESVTVPPRLGYFRTWDRIRPRVIDGLFADTFGKLEQQL